MEKVIYYNLKNEMVDKLKNILSKIFVLSVVLFGSCTNSEYEDPELKSEVLTPSAEGDIIGKIVVGYQGWFGAEGDGSLFKGWRHWVASGPPSPNNQSFELYPDVREYDKTYQTGYANLGNGNPAKLFSSLDDQTVDVHFKWMKEYGIHTAAVQRFGNYINVDNRDEDFKDRVVQKAKNAAEAHQVKFFIWYDISGWNNFQSEIKSDWLNKMKAYSNSGMYAKQNDMPVVCIWGLGVKDRPGDAASYLDVINWFKKEGCYVIIGTSRDWRNQGDKTEAYKAANMINPWTVGSFKGLSEADGYKQEMQKDLEFCNSNNQDYLPVVFPGFAWSNWNGGAKNDFPRLHGDFMWRQFTNIAKLGIQSSYVAMFDEYDEGTAIAKAAENSSQIPSNQYFLTLDADGVEVSSDFYLRLTGDAAKLLSKQIPITEQHPTAHKP